MYYDDQDFDKWIRTGGANVMTWRCSGNKSDLETAKRNLMFMNHVLLVETFDKDLKGLEYKLNKMFYQNSDMKVLKRNVNKFK